MRMQTSWRCLSAVDAPFPRVGGRTESWVAGREPLERRACRGRPSIICCSRAPSRVEGLVPSSGVCANACRESSRVAGRLPSSAACGLERRHESPSRVAGRPPASPRHADRPEPPSRDPSRVVGRPPHPSRALAGHWGTLEMSHASRTASGGSQLPVREVHAPWHCSSPSRKPPYSSPEVSGAAAACVGLQPPSGKSCCKRSKRASTPAATSRKDFPMLPNGAPCKPRCTRKASWYSSRACWYSP